MFFFFSSSEARRDLKILITETKETIDDPQKLQGRLAKDEKVSTTTLKEVFHNLLCDTVSLFIITLYKFL